MWLFAADVPTRAADVATGAQAEPHKERPDISYLGQAATSSTRSPTDGKPLMKTHIVDLPGRTRTKLPLSPGVIAEGKFLFVSGHGPFDPTVGSFVRGTMGEQTRLTLESLKLVIETAGATMDDVVSCRVFLQQITEKTFAEMNEVFMDFFPGDKPARTTVGCQLLNIDVEIDCIVRMPS